MHTLTRERPRVFHALYGPGCTLPILTEAGFAWVKFDGNDEFAGGRRKVLRKDLARELVVALPTMRGVA
jgi:hypothetical protein